MSTTITSVLLFNTDPQTLVADVLGADPTATTLLLNCPSGTDSNDCGTYNVTVTYGAWAKPTPPPDAATSGVYDLRVTEGTEWFYSQHCEMSSTVPVVCTTTNLGGNDDGSPTSTFSSLDATGDFFGWAYMPVTITAGLEILATAATATTATSRVTSGTTAASTSETTLLSGTRSAATPTATSAAGRGQHGDAFAGTLALVCLVVGWLVR